MANSISDKLKIRENNVLLTVNAPPEFKKGLRGIPTGVKITDHGKTYDQVHWFLYNRAQLEKGMSKVMKLLKPGIIVWAYYPKGTSKLKSDLTRDKGWDCLLAEGDKLAWISLISFDETWSVFGFRPKTDEDRKKEARPAAPREVYNWANPKTKEVTLPPDLASAFVKNKRESLFFDSLSFTNKKEYLEWIVTAKREETRVSRIKGSIERLKKKWKNPRNM